LLLFDEAGVELDGTDVPITGLASGAWDVTGGAGFTAGAEVFVADFGIGGIGGGGGVFAVSCAFDGAATGMEGGWNILSNAEDGDDGDDSVGEVRGIDGWMSSVRDSGSEKGNPFGKLGVLVEHSNNPLPSVTRMGSGAL
jgi:hypothetical protein